MRVGWAGLVRQQWSLIFGVIDILKNLKKKTKLEVHHNIKDTDVLVCVYRPAKKGCDWGGGWINESEGGSTDDSYCIC